MTKNELRKIIKSILEAQNGKFYGFNYNNLIAAYNVSGTQIQNAYNYFKYSPQQKKFRETRGL